MKKDIVLSSGKKITYDTESDAGYDEILFFYEPKIKTLAYGFKHVPQYDQDDLIQVFRIKLLDALKNFDVSKNVNFSTYVYTVWHRKVLQIITKYKSKKYSRYIQNDNNLNSNHKYDKQNEAQYLQVSKDKCPIKKEVISLNTCLNCPYHVKYDNVKIDKGKHKDTIEKFTLCKYYKEVWDKRGIFQKSLDYTGQLDDKKNLNEFISCEKQKKVFEENEFSLDLEMIKDKIGEKPYSVLTLFLDGLNKSEVMRELNMQSSE